MYGLHATVQIALLAVSLISRLLQISLNGYLLRGEAYMYVGVGILNLPFKSKTKSVWNIHMYIIMYTCTQVYMVSVYCFTQLYSNKASFYLTYVPRVYCIVLVLHCYR